MKIAVTYDRGNVFQHFGKTQFFKIYEIENNEIKKAEVVSNNGITHCALIDYLKELKVDALICGGLGYGAISKLESLGIKLYAGVSGLADKAIDDLLNNSLNYDNSKSCEEENLHSCHDDISPLI